jgi:threonine dehydratase
MYNVLKGASLPTGGDTLAEGIAVKEPGKFTQKVLAGLLDDFVLVNRSAMEHALALLLQIEKTVVEGAGAAGLAAVLENREMFAGRNVGIVLSGGNIDQRLLANVLLRDLARSGRLARLRLVLQDRPGALFKVMEEFDRHQVNILEVYHQRIFTHLPAKGLTADIECEARDGGQIAALIAALRAKGYEVNQAEPN